MLVKCFCTNCAGHLAFEEAYAGTNIDCPHCGFQTTLFLPGTQPPDAVMVSLVKRLLLRRRLLWIGAGILIVAALGFVLQRWGLPLVEQLLPENTAKAWAVILLLAFCVLGPIAAVLALFWLAFPVLIVFQLRHLTRVLAQLEANSRPISAEEAEAEEARL